MRYIPRTDQYGTPLAQPPAGRTLLLTGPAGSGKSTELDRLEHEARSGGHLVFRIKALTEEYLGNQAVRAVNAQLDDIARQLPPAGRFRRGLTGLRDRVLNWRGKRRPADDPRMEALRETADAMGGLRRAQRKGSMWAAGVFGVGGRSMDAVDRQTELPRATLNDLSDKLGDVARLSGRQVVFLVDDIHALDEKKGLAAFNEWARHLGGREDGNVHLAAAGRSEVYGRLATASSMMDGVYHDPSRLFDHRQPQPVPAAELHRSMLDSTHPSVQVSDGAAERLLDAAAGNPQRMQEYHQAALGFVQHAPDASQYPYRLDAASATAGINAVHQRRQPLYAAVWTDLDDADRELLSQVADRGARGLPRADVRTSVGEATDPSTAPDPEKLGKLNRAREKAVQAGWLTESDRGRIRYADAGLGDWVRTEQLGKPALVQPPDPAAAELSRQHLPQQQIGRQPAAPGIGTQPAEQPTGPGGRHRATSAPDAARLAATGQLTGPPGPNTPAAGAGRPQSTPYTGRHRRENGPQQGSGR